MFEQGAHHRGWNNILNTLLPLMIMKEFSNTLKLWNNQTEFHKHAAREQQLTQKADCSSQNIISFQLNKGEDFFKEKTQFVAVIFTITYLQKNWESNQKINTIVVHFGPIDSTLVVLMKIQIKWE